MREANGTGVIARHSSHNNGAHGPEDQRQRLTVTKVTSRYVHGFSCHRDGASQHIPINMLQIRSPRNYPYRRDGLRSGYKSPTTHYFFVFVRQEDDVLSCFFRYFITATYVHSFSHHALPSIIATCIIRRVYVPDTRMPDQCSPACELRGYQPHPDPRR